MNLTIEAVPVHPRRGGRETAMENGTMRAWVLEEPGRLALRSIAIPEAKDDQLLVKIDRACICNGSDPGIYHGRPAYETPCVFGHEGSGRIVKVGKDAGDFCVGERVFWWFEMGSFAEYQAITPSRTAVCRSRSAGMRLPSWSLSWLPAGRLCAVPRAREDAAC